jgi:hypothetical protein
MMLETPKMKRAATGNFLTISVITMTMSWKGAQKLPFLDHL